VLARRHTRWLRVFPPPRCAMPTRTHGRSKRIVRYAKRCDCREAFDMPTHTPGVQDMLRAQELYAEMRLKHKISVGRASLVALLNATSKSLGLPSVSRCRSYHSFTCRALPCLGPLSAACASVDVRAESF
jgi:hypothetical protein